MGVWIPLLAGGISLPSAFDPVTWHFHELLFGFVGAAMAGFLLTAIPNWTGRLPLEGWPLAALVLLWAAGRAAVAFGAALGMAAAVIDVSFLAVFGAIVAREIIAGRNWRNAPVVAAITLLVVANAMLHAGVLGIGPTGDAGKRLAISVVVMLISLIGGRIIPSFTGNWLRRRGSEALPAPFDRSDKAALAMSVLALSMWVILDLNAATGVVLILAALAHALRLARWRGAATRSEPLLWILHFGYAWVPVGLGLLGTSAWKADLTTSAIHGLTVGAMGTMILAVMTRASLGHTGAPLTADRGTVIVYLLVLIAAVLRMAAPVFPAIYMPLLDAAAAAWIAGFALFTVLYLPRYVRK
jgi:uncharacterized protein involved in response to NO